MKEQKGTDEEDVKKRGSKNVTMRKRQRQPFGIW
jgi:hypothetical protein